jgi:N,N'-diacetyl-8-epilegionaminate cytidylyltransferase
MTNSPRTIAFIFARGGSKGVPRKNVRLVDGLPLIAYSINTARQSRLVQRVIVSTDDEEIARVAQEHGAEVPFMRPAPLATDDSPEWLSWQHAVQTVGASSFDIFLSVPVTSPLRAVEDLDRTIGALDDSADVVITVSEARRNPYFNMVTLDDAGFARIVNESAGGPTRRQAAPKVFDITTVAYAVRPSFILSNSSLFAGRVKGVTVPEERALDIDTPLDLEIAEFLLHRRRLQS